MPARGINWLRSRRHPVLTIAALVALMLGGVVLATAASKANPTYDRLAAITWALNHSEDRQIAPTECTWFVSQALWAGGLPQTAQWNGTSSHDAGRLTGTVPGTLTAWSVPDLISYLESNFPYTWTPLGNMSENAVPAAQVGDIIVYDWHNDGTYDHMAMITGFASGDYPLVSEMGQFNWTFNPEFYLVHPASDYIQRGWTWSQEDNKWLETEYGGEARAYLLHINLPASNTAAQNPTTTTSPPTTSAPTTTTSTAPPTTTTTSPPPITTTTLAPTPSANPASTSANTGPQPSSTATAPANSNPAPASDEQNLLTPYDISTTAGASDNPIAYTVNYSEPACPYDEQPDVVDCAYLDHVWCTTSVSGAYEPSQGPFGATPGEARSSGFFVTWPDDPPSSYASQIDLSPGDTYVCSVQETSENGITGPVVTTAPFTTISEEPSY